MGYDRGGSFPFDFEPNGISLGSKSEEKLSPRSFNMKGNGNIVFSVQDGFEINFLRRFFLSIH